jgi:gamma-glutamyl-gamma-aminobutyrate hydrolase PuuD
VIERALKRKIPLFGVCLGHQGIGEYFGGELGVLGTPMHGKPSLIRHAGKSILAGVPSPFPAGRYHSLYVKRESLPKDLEIRGETEDGVIMAMADAADRIRAIPPGVDPHVEERERAAPDRQHLHGVFGEAAVVMARSASRDRRESWGAARR